MAVSLWELSCAGTRAGNTSKDTAAIPRAARQCRFIRPPRRRGVNNEHALVSRWRKSKRRWAPAWVLAQTGFMARLLDVVLFAYRLYMIGNSIGGGSPMRPRARSQHRAAKPRGLAALRNILCQFSVQEVVSFKSSSACLLAFLVSALASASGANPLMALPRLTASAPVTLALRASNPPGMLRFFATCAAATHCPIFLKPPQAVCASSPVNVLILPAIAVLWLRTSLGAPCDMLELAVEPAPCELLMPGSLPGPCPAGGPPPGCERCAKAGAAKASASVVTMARMRRFTVIPPS